MSTDGGLAQAADCVTSTATCAAPQTARRHSTCPHVTSHSRPCLQGPPLSKHKIRPKGRNWCVEGGGVGERVVEREEGKNKKSQFPSNSSSVFFITSHVTARASLAEGWRRHDILYEAPLLPQADLASRLTILKPLSSLSTFGLHKATVTQCFPRIDILLPGNAWQRRLLHCASKNSRGK